MIADRYIFGVATANVLYAPSVEMVQVPVSASLAGVVVVPTGLAASYAVVGVSGVPVSSDWKTAQWITLASVVGTRYAIGIVVSAVAVGEYDLWVKVTDGTIVPVKYVGRLQVRETGGFEMPFLESGAIMEAQAGAKIIVDSSSEIDIAGLLNIFSAGTAEVKSGGSLKIDPGALANMLTVKSIPLTGGTDTGGGLGAWQNTTGYPVFAGVVLYVPTAGLATAACSAEVGMTATSATTAATNLITSQDVHAAQVAVWSAIANWQIVANGKWITVSTASGASAGLAGTLYVAFITLTTLP